MRRLAKQRCVLPRWWVIVGVPLLAFGGVLAFRALTALPKYDLSPRWTDTGGSPHEGSSAFTSRMVREAAAIERSSSLEAAARRGCAAYLSEQLGRAGLPVR